LEIHLLASNGAQAFFAVLHQLSSQSGTAGLGNGVEGQNAADFAKWLRHRETRNASGELAAFRKFCDQSDGVAARDEPGQVHLRVGNPWRKTLLVNAPQAIEVGSAVVADQEA